MLNDYLAIRQDMVELGYDNADSDDVKDYFVDVYADIQHFTDEELASMLVGYRTFETAYPEYVQRGNALIAG